MTCAEAKLKLEPCVSGTLSPEERIELEEHLAICEGCRLELELTRAVMGAPSFESADESHAAAAPEAPPFATDSPSFAAETPPPDPEHPQSRPQTPVYDEVSFADIASSAGQTAEPPVAAGTDAGSSEPDPFANFTKKPEEPAGSTSATWDFEPAEVPRDSSPPEGSLSFANEALKRKHEAEERRKATLVRIALWGGGIGCGVLLLGISVWIALAFRQDKAPDLPPGGENPSATPQTQTQTETATPAPPEHTATPNAPDGGAAAPPPATVEQTAPTPPPSEAPAQPAPTILDATPGVVASPGPPPPGKSGSKGKPKPGTKGAGKTTSTASKDGGDEGEFPWKPVDDTPPARTSSGRTGGGSAPGAATSPTPEAGAPRTGEAETAPPRRPTPVNPPDAAAPDQGMPPFSSAPNTGGAAPTSPSPQPSGEPAEQSPAPAVTKPIDRLHLATETAAKNADLTALRKIKSSWKSLVASTAGPDRTRAKLEYADCLWAIQEVSGRNSDRREALTAYRDFVLNAPAGGTNARTVSRMRYLEDILADK